MLFNSLDFGIFFFMIFVIYFAIPKNYQWVLLLIASYYFYMSYKAELVVLIFACTIINYVCAILIEKYPKIKKIFLIISLTVSLSLLLFFKYFNFFNNAIADFFEIFSLHFSKSTLEILLPMGISFYTLQTLSYTIDVYRGTIKAERHFGYVALFVSFFPQLVAGPIERASSLLPQLKTKHYFDYDNAIYGLKLMAIGFFKKLVIADNVARYVNEVYNNVESYSGGVLVLATALFIVQLYCDFSGYSDMARGMARVLGFELTINFKEPYLSPNIAEYWKRNHVSLSIWFKDYLYIPLGGNKSYIRNMIIVWGISGFWHGANYTFIVWGLLNGIYLVFYKYYKKYIKGKINFNHKFEWLAVLVNLFFLGIGLIFFRANNITDAMYVIENMFVGITNLKDYIYFTFVDIGMGFTKLIQVFATIGILFLYDRVNYKEDAIVKISKAPIVARWAWWILIILMIIILAPKNAPAEFIYFEF